jgi:hypothetical protein
LDKNEKGDENLCHVHTPVKIFTHPCILQFNKSSIHIESALIDSGASACFIDSDFVTKYGIPTVKKVNPVKVEVIDGRSLASGAITRETISIRMKFGDHCEKISFSIIKSPKHPIVLGMSWLTIHNPNINWAKRTLQFDNCNCSVVRLTTPSQSSPVSAPVPTSPYLPPASQLTLVKGIAPVEEIIPVQMQSRESFQHPDPSPIQPVPVQPSRSTSPDSLPDIRRKFSFTDFNRFQSSVTPKSPNNPAVPLKVSFRVPSSSEDSPVFAPVPSSSNIPTPVSSRIPVVPVPSSSNVPASQVQVPVSSPAPAPAPVPVPARVDAHVRTLVKRRGYCAPSSSSPSSSSSNPVIPDSSPSLSSSQDSPPASRSFPRCTISMLNARSFVTASRGNPVYIMYAHPASDPQPTALSTLPDKYSEFADVFSKENADILPEHRPYDCPIDLQENAQPPFGPIYNLSQPELKALREYIDENLAKGFIRHSKSPAGAPILFVKKKDGSLRLCVDYRGLNALTIRNRYPLPLIPQLLDQLSQAKIFTKIDLRGAYNLVRIREGDEWKTAFRTRYGHFEYTVMPFGLTNAPAVFQHMMNDIFRQYLDQFVVVYLDDVLVYSRSVEEHEKHVKLVLQKLREMHLYAKLEKCEFDTDTVEFLGYVISPKGISMDKTKVNTLLSWATPKSVRDVQCFLGFANFYRAFIKDYSTMAAPLIALTRKNRPFEWNSAAQNAFDKLKTLFTTAPILAHADPSRPFIVETDGSDFALGAVLSQVKDDGALHPIAFYSRKFSAAEINYQIYDKELLAIVSAFEHWRNYLYGTQHQVTVYTDHKNLLYYTTTRTLNRRQARWSLFLSEFNFVIQYRPGKEQGKPDALSRRSEYKPKEGEEAIVQQQQVVLKPEMLKLAASYTTPEDDMLLTHVRKALETDELGSKIFKSLSNGELSEFSADDGLLYYKGLLYLPDLNSRLLVLRSRHDSPAAGHYGSRKTLELVSRDYWWPRMDKFIAKYVKTCDVCSRSKAPRHRPFGLLQPLPIPDKPWESISMDFITDLPKSSSYDSILVIVDRFSKMAHFVPCTKCITAEQTANLVLQNVVRLHGLPMEIVSDRGPQFAAKFWKCLFQFFDTKISLSSAFHPQTDGQSERVNQVLEQYLRCTTNYLQNDWVKLLPLAEFSYNNSVHASTQKTPFFVNYGFHPKFEVLKLKNSRNPAAENYASVLDLVQRELRLELVKAQENYKKQADKSRMPCPEFKIGDQVWLLRKNIKTSRPCEKLDYKRLGPFRITQQINPVAFRLQLPDSFKCHNVFHASLLEPYHANEFPGRQVLPPPPVKVQGQDEYEVSEILDSKIRWKKVYYLVHWAGYEINERTWEPAENLVNAQEKVLEFHQKHPEKPGPPSLLRRALERR